jgi:GNAT superfamily N-acetyltransferase
MPSYVIPDLASVAVRVRAMHTCDLDFVTSLHRDEFPTNVVTRFGTALLRGYYTSFVASPHAVAYVAEVNGQVVGYLVGIVRLGRHRRRLLRRHAILLAPAAALGAIARPRLAVALVRARLARRAAGRRAEVRDPEAGGAHTEPFVAVLSHVAVARSHRGLGLGAALVEKFEQEAMATGVTRLCLATTEESGARGFYERRGWVQAARRRTFDHRPIRLLELDLSQRRTPPCADPAS